MPAYTDNQIGKPADQPTQPKLDAIYSRLSNYNSEYFSLLSGLEDKLNKVLDRRTPEKESSPTSKEARDFVTSVHQQLDYLESHNAYLSRLLSHLSEIV